MLPKMCGMVPKMCSVKNVWHGAKNVRHGAGNVRHGTKNVRHGTKNLRHGAKNVRHGAPIPQSPNPQIPYSMEYYKSLGASEQRTDKKLPWTQKVALNTSLGCQCVKLFFSEMSQKLCYKKCDKKLWQKKFCQNLIFWVFLQFWFCHNLRFLVLSQF